MNRNAVIFVTLAVFTFCGTPARKQEEQTFSLRPVLFQAAKAGDLETVRIAVIGGRDVQVNERDQDGLTPLMYAAGLGHVEIVKYLLEHKADPHLAAPAGRTKRFTALSWAACAGHVDVVRVLAGQGVNINYQDEIGWTPIMCAGFGRYTKVVDYLLEQKADVRLRDRNGNDLMHIAAAAAQNELIRRLVKQGLDPGGKNAFHRTPLMDAAQNGHEETVKLLVSLGVDRAVVAQSGKTAAVMAREAGHARIARILEGPHP